jgi:hypothetical protein
VCVCVMGLSPGDANVSDDPSLSELMETLARAKDTEASARMDVKDRRADEKDAIAKRERAEGDLLGCIERSRRARAAINDYVEWQTRSPIEEADELMAQVRLIQDKRK